MLTIWQKIQRLQYRMICDSKKDRHNRHLCLMAATNTCYTNASHTAYLDALIVEANLWHLVNCIHWLGSFSNVCASDLFQQSFAFLYQIRISVCRTTYYLQSHCKKLNDTVYIFKLHTFCIRTRKDTTCRRLLPNNMNISRWNVIWFRLPLHHN